MSRSTRKQLNHAQIVTAAIQLADQGGLKQLSMRKLADRLSVEAMSLYHYIPNKEALLDAMVDAIVDKMALPDLQLPWPEALAKRALSAYHILIQHPWAAEPLLSRINVGPAMLRYFNHSLQCLCQAGFDLSQADHILISLDSYVYGFVLRELSYPLAPEEYASAASAFLPQIDQQAYPYFCALAEEVIQGRYSGVADFHFGLKRLLWGLNIQEDRHDKSTLW